MDNAPASLRPRHVLDTCSTPAPTPLKQSAAGRGARGLRGGSSHAAELRPGSGRAGSRTAMIAGPGGAMRIRMRIYRPAGDSRKVRVPIFLFYPWRRLRDRQRREPRAAVPPDLPRMTGCIVVARRTTGRRPKPPFPGGTTTTAGHRRAMGAPATRRGAGGRPGAASPWAAKAPVRQAGRRDSRTCAPATTAAFRPWPAQMLVYPLDGLCIFDPRPAVLRGVWTRPIS